MTQTNITQSLPIMFVYFYRMKVKLGKSKNAVNADRIMKFIDENELNNI